MTARNITTKDVTVMATGDTYSYKSYTQRSNTAIYNIDVDLAQPQYSGTITRSGNGETKETVVLSIPALGVPITYDITVTRAYSGDFSGNIDFYEGGTVVDSVSIVEGGNDSLPITVSGTTSGSERFYVEAEAGVDEFDNWDIELDVNSLEIQLRENTTTAITET